MRNEVMWAIRDARGLSSQEKVFLMCVESRGIMYSTQANAAQDMGLSKSMFYKTRKLLIQKGLVWAHQRGSNGTTQYRVNRPAVTALIPSKTASAEIAEESWWESQESTAETDLSPQETEQSTGETAASPSEVESLTSDQAIVSPRASEANPQNNDEDDQEVGQENPPRNPHLEKSSLFEHPQLLQTFRPTPVSGPSNELLRSILESIDQEVSDQIVALILELESARRGEWSGMHIGANLASLKVVIDGRLRNSSWPHLTLDEQTDLAERAWEELGEEFRLAVWDLFPEDLGEYMTISGWILRRHIEAGNNQKVSSK